jgi:aspartate kinase
MIVMKFGGASLGDADRIRRVCAIVRAHRRKRPVLVLSALKDVTDQLIHVAHVAAAGNREDVEVGVDALDARHRQVVERLFPDASVRLPALEQVARLVHEVEDYFHGISLLGELSRRSLDVVTSIGERLSCRIVAAALADQRVPAAYVDARDFLVTDEDHGRAQVDFRATNRGLRRVLLPRVAGGDVPVVTGFIAATRAGVTTTLGRGGSDYTASILGAGLEAREIWVWKEVDGVCTSDPTLFPDARVVPHISYREAAELSHFGAEVLHPRTMLPAMRRGIPIRVKNTLQPDSAGTLITARGSRTPNPMIVSSIDGLSLVTVEGTGLVGSPALVARVIEEVAAVGVNLYMVSMASSEYNVTIAVPSAETARVVRRLNETLGVDRRGGEDVQNIQVEDGVAIIATVGAGLKGQIGIAGKVFSALGRHGVNILAIAQGSSELNITMAVGSRDLKRAVRAIHGDVVAGGDRPSDGRRSATSGASVLAGRPSISNGAGPSRRSRRRARGRSSRGSAEGVRERGER